MGVRERLRPKKKEAEEKREKVVQVSEQGEACDAPLVKEVKSTARPVEHERVSVTPGQKTVVTHPEVQQTTVAVVTLPKWGDVEQSEWMYHIPVREQDIEPWSLEWSDYLLEWLRARNVHIVSFTTFIEEIPFKEILDKATAFSLIAQILIDRDLAEWFDKKRRQLRVYWRTLEEWALIIYHWALRTGLTRLDVKSMVIQEPNKEIAGIPEKDLQTIMQTLVHDELADWVDKKKGAIRIRVQ